MSPAIAASAAASRTASRIAAVRPAAAVRDFQSAAKFGTTRPTAKYPAACQIAAARFIFVIYVVATVTCGPPDVKDPIPQIIFLFVDEDRKIHRLRSSENRKILYKWDTDDDVISPTRSYACFGEYEYISST